MRKDKRATFDPLGDKIIPRAKHQIERTKDQLKSSWYSREDLMESCVEARKIVTMINSVNGDMDAIDHSRVCVVGLEKFHSKKEREKYRKLLIRSVLIRQEMNRGLGLRYDVNCLSEISQLISSSFKEFALWQAAMHKFHAYGPLSEPEVSTNELSSPDHAQAKRQKLMTGYCSIPTPSALSSNLAQNPEQVRAELQQLMAGYCSR
jgi:hypothetical protein